MTGLLTLDISTKTGWAFASVEAIAAWPKGVPGEQGPIQGVAYGTRRLAPPSSGHGLYGLGMHALVGDLIQRYQPKVIVYESPLPPQKRDTLNILRLLGGLAFMAECVAQTYNTPIYEENVSTVRKHFIGWCRGDRQKIKHDTIWMCQARGWTPQTDDEADALALLDLSVCVYGDKLLKYGRAA